MKTLINFLTAAAKNAAETLVRTLVAKMKKATNDAKLTTIVTAAVTVLRALGMTEETRMLGLIVLCHFGGRGVEVPAAIANLFAPPTTAPMEFPLVPVKAIISRVAAPAPMPAKPAPVPATAPARTLIAEEPKTFVLENGMKTWFGFLTGITRGNKVPWKALQSLTTKVFTAGAKLTQERWELLFAALKKANESGNHILENAARPAAIFVAAPVELVDDYLFGQDGIVPPLTGEIVDCSGEMPPWLCAKVSIALDAIEVVDAQGDGLGEQENKLFGNLLDAIETKNGPSWLVEKGRMIWGNGDPESDEPEPATERIGNGGARIIGDLSSVVKTNGGNGNGKVAAAAVAAATTAKAEFIEALRTTGSAAKSTEPVLMSQPEAEATVALAEARLAEDASAEEPVPATIQ